MNKNNVYGKKMMAYAAKYRNQNISILVDRMPLTQEDYALLAELFPNSRVVMCEDLCVRYGRSFYALSADCIEDNDMYLILETSAGRVDHLERLLTEKGVPSGAILTGVSQYRQQMEIGQLLRLQHFDCSVYNADTFSRHAIVIRYLFVEAWLRGDPEGMELYRKYLSAKKYGPYDYMKEKFEKLIRSFQTNGAKDLWIAVDESGRIIDGSHRMAICFALGIRHIPVRFMNTSERLDSGREWLSKHFSVDEQETVVRKYLELANRYL